MKKLFVTGASGLLGSNIITSAPTDFKKFGLDLNDNVVFEDCKLYKADLTKKNQLNIIKEEQPDLVIHCAAYVNVDGCEKEPDKAHLGNVVTTENIAEICEKVGSFLIHISTDSVFDGKKGNYSEEDATNPINVYGKTKLEAEKAIQNYNLDYCIARTNIYGWNKLDKYSIAEWMINRFEKNEEIPAFYDTIFSPILVNNLTRALFEIYEKKITGILHTAGSEKCSKYDFANYISEVFNFDTNLIKKTSIETLNLQAKRGKNLGLNTKKAQKILDTKLLNAKQGLEEMKALKEESYVKKLKIA